ncbi:MAG: PepSY domain-containing protein [Pirellulales bacterium]|nr:PepSY domain-containing protein [Pirellulales bacterium]
MKTTTWDKFDLKDPQNRDAQPRRKKRHGKLYGTTMRLIRRVHLYSGLFMLPFVLLYGISAVYFNHPGLISTSTTEYFDADTLASAGLQNLPEAEVLASEVVQAINTSKAAEEEEGESRPQLALSDQSAPRFTGSMSYSYRGEDEQYSISINPAAQTARLRRSELSSNNERPKAPNPFAKLPEQPQLVDLVRESRSVAATIVNQAGASSELLGNPQLLSPGRRSGTRLQFDAIADGVTYRVAYDLASGRGAAVPLGEAREIELERFLMRLHESHGYPDEMNIRWWWAVVVDAMFVNMVVWALSGALMWWQLKKTRKLGMVFVVASAVVTCWLFVGMHQQMIESSRARNLRIPTSNQGRSSRPDQDRRRSQESGRRNVSKPEQAQPASRGQSLTVANQ